MAVRWTLRWHWQKILHASHKIAGARTRSLHTNNGRSPLTTLCATRRAMVLRLSIQERLREGPAVSEPGMVGMVAQAIFSERNNLPLSLSTKCFISDKGALS